MENELNFCGIGSWGYPEAGFTSAYYFIGRRLVLLDCGISTFLYLREHTDKFKETIDDVEIYLTHLHEDHINGLSCTIFELTVRLGVKLSDIRIIHPNKSDLFTYMKLIVKTDDTSYTSCIRDGSEADVKTLVQSCKTKHGAMDNFGYVLCGNNAKLIYYSGDTPTIPKYVLDNKGIIDEFYVGARVLPTRGQERHMHEKYVISVLYDVIGKVTFMHFASEANWQHFKAKGYNLACEID